MINNYTKMPLQGADRFRIEREIKKTLQGRIYTGIDLLTNKKVVIKEAWRQLVHSGRSRDGHRVSENFLKERKLIMELASLNDIHNGIVKGIAEWDDEYCYYYAMEYCESELFDYVKEGPLVDIINESKTKEQIPMNKSTEWVINVSKMFKQICLAVQWLHSKELCHLDLSLENTMISDLNNLTVKIIDLGLTQKFNNNNFRFQGRVGKVQYMCPEAYAGQVYDAKAADVYCLGVILWIMLTGVPPYPKNQAPQPQNIAFNYIISGKCDQLLKHWKRLTLITTDALDLLNNMLTYENKRITLDKVLKHPFFKNLEQEQKGNNNNNNNLVPVSMDEKNNKQEIEREDIDVMHNNNNNVRSKNKQAHVFSQQQPPNQQNNEYNYQHNHTYQQFVNYNYQSNINYNGNYNQNIIGDGVREVNLS